MKSGSSNPLSYALAWIAAEVSTLSRYYDAVVQWRPRSQDHGQLLDQIECAHKTVASTGEQLREICATHGSVLVLFNGNTNYDLDIQATFEEVHRYLNRSSRVVLVSYNSYLTWAYRLAKWLGLRRDEIPATFITRTSLACLCKLAGFEVVRSRPCCPSPLNLGPLSAVFNQISALMPLSRTSALAEVTTLRPVKSETTRPSLSIIVPARNERGNLRRILEEIPDLDCQMEVVFVEGHSTDGTWEELQRLIPEYRHRFPIQSIQQSGVGKCDAVRSGFSRASGEVLTILDADLTMPAPMLRRFYDAYLQGHGDFINGNRLTYPMEGKAMRFLNRLGNLFFAKSLSSVLEVPLGDSLCGTKLVSRVTYDKMCQWRADFGDFDPFGDFELLFPAAILGLGIMDMPIHYRDRVYGSTNISRFRHGFILLKMTCIGLFRVRLSPPPRRPSRVR
ncbi:glycosyltransferase family 2 protein [bacterium]|nr:glycosyltransferase family 2 protein [bacterium]